MTQSQAAVLKALAETWSLAPDLRFGQLMANLGFITEDQTDSSLWDIEDDSLLAVIENHRSNLSRRQSQVA